MSPPPRGGQYSLSIISLSLKLVLNAGSSLRGAAAAMTQRRCNERPVTEQEFMTIAKIVI